MPHSALPPCWSTSILSIIIMETAKRAGLYATVLIPDHSRSFGGTEPSGTLTGGSGSKSFESAHCENSITFMFFVSDSSSC
jgi:hypothetical protein